MVKRIFADYIVSLSMNAKYYHELEKWGDHLDLPKIIKRVLNRDIKMKYHWFLPDCHFPIVAFLGCETAEKYFDLLYNLESRKTLQNPLVGIIPGYNLLK